MKHKAVVRKLARRIADFEYSMSHHNNNDTVKEGRKASGGYRCPGSQQRR